MGVVADTAEAILVAHQRRDISSCLCGWSELGRSHARHQVAMLRVASVLAEDRQEDVPAPGGAGTRQEPEAGGR